MMRHGRPANEARAMDVKIVQPPGRARMADKGHRVIDIVNARRRMSWTFCVDCGASWEDGVDFPPECVGAAP